MDELPFLLRLLDDDEPAVCRKLEEHFDAFRGDISHELDRLGIEIRATERKRLGTTLREPLPDVLDHLADEVVLRDAHRDARSLCEFLFGSGRFRGNSGGYYHPENGDLLWILTHRRGNPIGLALVAILVGQRLGLPIMGCNFPGHFLAWVGEGPETKLIDCYHRGRVISLEELRGSREALSPAAREAIKSPCTQRTILLRVIANLHLAFSQSGAAENADLARELLESLRPPE
jgi:regulator of sirC expression with transglutaminase-like and TPR domain